MIQNLLILSKENGGDGDPLDIIVLGPPVPRSSVVKCKIVGVLRLLDRGEQDDKLLAVSADSPLYEVNDIGDLRNDYKGVLDIVELWFSNYKGPGKMKSKGFGDSVEKFTKATGIKKVVDTVSKATGKPCGCSQRRDSLNRMFPYNK